MPRSPRVLYGSTVHPAIPQYLRHACPTMSASHLAAVLYVYFAIGDDIIIQRADRPTVVRTYIGKRLRSRAIIKDIRTAYLCTGYIIMTAFRRLAVHKEILLPPVIERITVASGNKGLCFQTTTIHNRDIFGKTFATDSRVAEITGRDVPHPTVFRLIQSNGNPTVFQVFIIFKLGFKADIRYTDLTDTSVECIFIDFATSKLLIHLHHDRVVNKKTVAFDLRDLTLESQVIFLRRPLACTFPFHDLIHLNGMDPFLGTGTVNDHPVAHLKTFCRRNPE